MSGGDPDRHALGLTRRNLLKLTLVAGAVSGAGGGCAAWSASEPTLVPLDPSGDDLPGTYRGTRYDSERKALLLAGETGSYARTGSFLSDPFRLDTTAAWNVTWLPRWTTALSWSRFEGNPVLEASPGAWDDSMVTTCSIIPSDDGLSMLYGARDRGIGLAFSDGSNLGHWRKHPLAVLEAGSRGRFDAGGVLSPAVVPVSDDLWYLYYVGYDPTRVLGSIKVHQVGLARSVDRGRTWTRVQAEPVLALGPRGSCDGASISSNSVLRIGDKWYCWYTGISQVPYLASVCFATSEDGIHWKKYPHNPVLGYNPYIETDAFMVATPHVLYEDGIFKMWYNSKGYGDRRSIGDYRIGYAESPDGIQWERCEKRPVFAPSHSGWDAQMVEYPEVVNLRGRHYMWYSGDGYGNVGYAAGDPVASASIETRTGDSPHPDGTWSRWQMHATAAGSRLAGMRRYVQLRVSLNTEDPVVSPMVQSIAFRCCTGHS